VSLIRTDIAATLENKVNTSKFRHKPLPPRDMVCSHQSRLTILFIPFEAEISLVAEGYTIYIYNTTQNLEVIISRNEIKLNNHNKQSLN
jgi:hypothetical protein